IGVGKSRQSLTDAADERPAILHRFERLGGSRRHGKAEREGRTEEKDCACHGTAFHGTVIFRVSTATCVNRKVFLNATFGTRWRPPAGVACPVQPHAPAALWSGRYLRTIGHGG